MTWEQFQEKFAATWFKRYMSPYIAERLDALLSYAEPLLPNWFGDLPPEQQQAFLDLKERYDEFGWVIMTFTPYTRVLRNAALPALPLINHLAPDSKVIQNVPSEILNAVGLRDFLELAIRFGDEVIAQFRSFRPEGAQAEKES